MEFLTLFRPVFPYFSQVTRPNALPASVETILISSTVNVLWPTVVPSRKGLQLVLQYPCIIYDLVSV